MFKQSKRTTQVANEVTFSDTDFREFLSERGIFIPEESNIRFIVPAGGALPQQRVILQWDEIEIDDAEVTETEPLALEYSK